MNLVRADHRAGVAFDVGAERALQVGKTELLLPRPRFEHLRIGRHRISAGARGVLTHDQVDARRRLNLAQHAHQALNVLQVLRRFDAEALIVAAEHDQVNVGRDLRHHGFPLRLPLWIGVIEIRGCRAGGRQFRHPNALLIIRHPKAEQRGRALHHFQSE